ncbi:MAG: TVP38/TMEM64 family protein [Pseudomonadota bacterium]
MAESENPPDAPAKSVVRRFLPIALIAVGAIAGILLARDYLSLSALAENYQALSAWKDANLILAILSFVGIYAVATAFSIPGGVWLTLIGGFLFGTVLGSVLVVSAATLGAMAIFIAARTALGDLLRSRASGWLAKMEAGFREGEVSYLLIMRLVPAIPFFVANIAPAFLGARPWTYLWTTFVGIIPGTVVYISLGAGLGEQLSRGETPNLGVIFEWHILGPMLGLAALAALPVVMKAFGAKGSVSSD